MKPHGEEWVGGVVGMKLHGEEWVVVVGEGRNCQLGKKSGLVEERKEEERIVAELLRLSKDRGKLLEILPPFPGGAVRVSKLPL